MIWTQGTGIDSSGTARIAAIEVKKRGPTECIVDVTAERGQSEPCKRKFEAKYRFTIAAGQHWFKSKLLAVKNTDSINYRLRGYYHQLTPADASSAPVCFPASAGWLSDQIALGALMDRSGPFTLGLRKTLDGPHGDITRRLDAKLNAGMTWEGNEPEVIIFTSSESNPRALYREAEKIGTLLDKPPSGRITYEERKQER